MTERWEVEVTKDTLVFSAAHFITFNRDVCERLHGHNWRVAAHVGGPLNENAYVFDFIALRDGLAAIIHDLDHRMLLPTHHPMIQVTREGAQVLARFRDNAHPERNRDWSFPEEDCVLLDVPNTTAEMLARHIGLSLLARIKSAGRPEPPMLRVRVEENFGQWATWERTS
jgi:6-pyruvoyltetrahydropterin/6-carboxytetrahydropterin synthase